GAQAKYKNRIGWAHDRLKRAGLSTCPRRGSWCLTEAGFAYVATHPTLAPADLAALIDVDVRSPLRPRVEGDEAASATGKPPTLDAGTRASPEDRIESALAEVREAVARDLLESIGRAPPEFFEQLVLDLLLAMGYGANRDALQRVGGSGDGGIDGIISLDRLGLEKVYVQAKRWKSTVGSPEIQGFMGALQLQGAAKGVFITTSLFTKEAKAAASKARGTIVLVDGPQLAEPMMDHGVGVSHKAIRVPRVDHDYFEDG
ncbi:MAG: restriction endonuclease, partial [Deltaproteobacteria bacterium]|nr:restriction endonuclease [Deltaproteobacteria bacterium]